MTIIHISTPLSWRGGEQQLSYLAEELKKQSVNQLVVCPEGSELLKKCKKIGVEYRSFKKKGFLKLALAQHIKEICKEIKHPLIHTHDSHAHTAAFMAAAFLGNKTPIFVSRRVDFPVKKSIFSRWKYNHKSIKKIICVSEKIKEITSPSIKYKGKLITIHSGIDLDRFDGVSASGFLRKTYNIPNEYKLIGNVAAIADHKDYFTFIDTAKELIQQKKMYKFFIIGAGPMENEISSYISKNSLEESVIMTGFLSNIPEILPELDVFLITSITEGLGTSVLDAFACKVPVVATRAGGIPEMVVHEVTGMLSEVKDTLSLAENCNKVIDNQGLKLSIIDNASLKLKQFTKEATAIKTLELYTKTLI